MFHCVHFSWMWCCTFHHTLHLKWDQLHFTFYLYFTCVLILFICLIFQKEWREDRHGEFKRKVARCVRKSQRLPSSDIHLAACSFTIFRVSKWTLPFHFTAKVLWLFFPQPDWLTDNSQTQSQKMQRTIIAGFKNHPFAECGLSLTNGGSPPSD